MYPQCGTCGKVFPSGSRARDNHCRSTGHLVECETCPRQFSSQQACNQHMNDSDHWPSFECSRCSATWLTQEECTAHEHLDHNYCGDCDRFFQSSNNLKMHLNSRTHRGQQIQCPFCPRLFTTASGVAHHLETGACPNTEDLNRDQMYRIVRSKDPGGLISKNLIEWTGSCQYEANDMAWNGDTFECYLCHRTFGSLYGLNQHLNSPTHQQALYHCPHRQCRMDFKSLAAIVNHLESEACGFARFEQIQRRMGDIVSGNRLIGF